jgi:hypothetical protein
MKTVHWGLLIVLVTVSLMVNTKDKKAGSYNSFYDQLSRKPYTVALFYDKSRENMRDNQMREQIKTLSIMFASVSEDPEYKDADLFFLTADIAHGDLLRVAQGLHIGQFPAIQLFVGRTALPGAMIHGVITREDIHNLINKYLRTRIDAYLKDKDAARERELERAKIRAYNRAYWGPYWYGYYGYPYGGWYGPGYGFYYGW